MTVKGFFKGIWEVFKYLFLTPSWGSKRRAEQRAYEEKLDEAMERRREEVRTRLRQYMEQEGVSSVSELGAKAPEHIYEKWGGEVSLIAIRMAIKELKKGE